MNSIAKAVGLGNLKGKKNRPKNEDIDLEIEEDEIEETEDAGSVEAEDVDEIDEIADEIADEAIEEAKDEAAQVVEEIVPAAPRKPANPAPIKEGKNMAYPLEFFQTVNKELYDALVNKLGVSTELRQAILDLTAIYPELRKDVVAQSADLDYQPPAWGWRYKALGCLKGKIFDSREDAEEAAEDLLNLGSKKFSELFVKAPFYLKEDGSFGEKVPEDSRDYEIIVASEAPANAEA